MTTRSDVYKGGDYRGEGDTTPNILVDPDPLTRGSAPGPRWGLSPQTPVPTIQKKSPPLDVYVTGILISFIREKFVENTVRVVQNVQVKIVGGGGLLSSMSAAR